MVTVKVWTSQKTPLTTIRTTIVSGLFRWFDSCSGLFRWFGSCFGLFRWFDSCSGLFRWFGSCSGLFDNAG